MGISQNYGIFKQRQLFYCHFKQVNHKNYFMTVSLRRLRSSSNFYSVDFFSLLSEVQTSGISQRVPGWECFGRNSCGWVLHIYVCVCGVNYFSLVRRPLSLSSGLVLVQKVYRAVSEWEYEERRIRKTTTGSASARGLSTALASCI